MSVDPRAFIEALAADLEPADARDLAIELARMIDLGVLELDDSDRGNSRIGIAPSDPDCLRAA